MDEFKSYTKSKTNNQNAPKSTTSGYSSVDIEGVNILFPKIPYPTQIEYMRNVINSIENRANALLQSPTGTGKTLCLLSASLAWLKKQSEKANKSGEPNFYKKNYIIHKYPVIKKNPLLAR